jgi:hypothetical protein
MFCRGPLKWTFIDSIFVIYEVAPSFCVSLEEKKLNCDSSAEDEELFILKGLEA